MPPTVDCYGRHASDLSAASATVYNNPGLTLSINVRVSRKLSGASQTFV